MGPALLELYATPSVKRQMSEKRDSSPQLFNSSPTTGRPMTRTLSMKAELIKDSTDGEKKLAASRSVESTYSLGGYSIKGGFMSRSSGGSSSLTSSPSSSVSASSLLLLPKSKTNSSSSAISTTTPTQANISSKCSSSLAKYFRLKFIGSAILDRRYTLPMLPWIINDIRRNSTHRNCKDIELEVNDICLKAVVKGERAPLFVHSHQFVSKFTPDPSDKASFTYLFRDHPDSQYTIYLFQSTSENMVLDLINAMREATKVLNFHSGSNLIQRSGTSNLDNILSNSQQFEVMYVGKIKVYQKRAPPSFIDDAVENFRTSEPIKVKFSDKEGDENIQFPSSDRSESETSVTPTASGSLSTSNSPTTTPSIVNQLGMQRPRSISSLTTCKEYKETLDEESPKEEVVMVTCLPKNDSMTSSTHPVTITCTSHNDEKDSVFSDEGRESMDDSSLNFSRPGSSASTASGGGSIFGISTGGTSLHLPSSSLITNTQSLDEQGRASIIRDLEVCSKHNQDSLSPIPSPNPPEEIYTPEEENDKKPVTTPIKIEIIDPRIIINTETPETKVTTTSPSSISSPVPTSLTPHPPSATPLVSLSPELVSSTPSSPNNGNNNNTNIPVRKLSTEKQVSLPYRTRTNSGGNSDLRRNRQSTKFQNRTMLFLIGRLEICLISPDLHQILFNKTFNYVSHCSQGVKYMDHFGFICREPSFYPSETYVGYVFRCQTDKLVNEIMHTLKQAFHNAHHAYQVNKNKSTAICETCPMQWFHRLCVDVESLPAEKAQTVILQRLDSLPDVDKNEVMSMYEGSQVSSIEEQNEIIMMLLRGMSERKQQKHNHHGKDDKRNSISTLDNLKQKAKKSLSNSFETILKLAQGDSNDDLSSSSNPSPKHGNRSDHSFFEVTSSRPRSSTIGDVKDLQEIGGRSGSISGSSGPTSSGSGVFGSGSGTSSGFGSVGGSISQGTPRLGLRSESIPLNGLGSQTKSPLYNIFMKIGTNNKSSASSSFDSASETGGGRRGLGGDGYNGSSIGSEDQSSGYSTWSSSSSGGSCKQNIKEQRGWRKTIFSNIKTTTTTKILDKYDSQDSSRYSLDSSSDNSSFNSSISAADTNVNSMESGVAVCQLFHNSREKVQLNFEIFGKKQLINKSH
ncbi:uncharacterized protein LOC128387556 isoform X2 [Panonychus citri]|uniref:uncharacterized protein LOC128387556 isoform X2 n=1 Tax=Panonychus citri TaxID=50023 RepID=UPI0023079D3D|nr:uncharacterized protein LOC128387556 isoform X2 [Panonychus citri]